MSDICTQPEPVHGRYTVYASQYARLTSDVIRGGGDDDTEVLQAILDCAPTWGGLHLVLDGAALVRGLVIHSSTTIECPNGRCGLFLADGANQALLRNAHQNYAERQDYHITLLDGVYNHNAAGQLHHTNIPEGASAREELERWSVAMRFTGVEHVVMRDVTIRNQRTFAMLMTNWRHVLIENMHIELPDNMYAQNQDGLHFWGPGEFLTIRDITGSSGDDFIALASGEHDPEHAGPITDVLIDGVMLDDADQGIRLLSRGTGVLDRIMVRNVCGTYKSFGFILNPWFPGPSGRFGQITIENIDLRQTVHKYDYSNPFLFRIGGEFEALTLRNVHLHRPTGQASLVEVGIPFYSPLDAEGAAASRIRSLVVDGLSICDIDRPQQSAPYIRLMGRIDRLVMRDITVDRTRTPAQFAPALICSEPFADVERLHIIGLDAQGLGAVLQCAGGHIGQAIIEQTDVDSETVPVVGEPYPDTVTLRVSVD